MIAIAIMILSDTVFLLVQRPPPFFAFVVKGVVVKIKVIFVFIFIIVVIAVFVAVFVAVNVIGLIFCAEPVVKVFVYQGLKQLVGYVKRLFNLLFFSDKHDIDARIRALQQEQFFTENKRWRDRESVRIFTYDARRGNPQLVVRGCFYCQSALTAVAFEYFTPS
ncbi:hypothetical protein SDC9_135351 [bioreactor metagenome]|uniref:Uncharacterized protein n=1 Tax=bioreactor metagenome TaxID=1076179 RepID=A0A645DFJ1_9ZZZZ